MKFLVQPSDLRRAFSSVSKVLISKNAMPVLDNVLFRDGGDGKSLTITGSDGDNTVTVSLAVDELTDPVPFLINASTLDSYLKNGVGEWPIDITIDHGEITFSDIMGDFKMLVNSDTNEFPVLRDINPIYSSTIDAAPVVAASTLAIKCSLIDKDNLRPTMTGVFFDFQQDGLRIAASDQKKLFRDVIESVQTPRQCSVIVPAKVISMFQLVDTTKTIDISFDNSSIIIRQDGIQMRGRLIEGKYPRYEAVIPKNNTSVATVDRSVLIAAIKRSMIAANSATQQIKVVFDGSSRVSIEAQDIDSSTRSVVRVDNVEQVNVPSGFAIGFRAPFLTDVLNLHKECQKVSILMSDPARAALVKPSMDSLRLTLIMPMMLTDF